MVQTIQTNNKNSHINVLCTDISNLMDKIITVSPATLLPQTKQCIYLGNYVISFANVKTKIVINARASISNFTFYPYTPACTRSLHKKVK